MRDTDTESEMDGYGPRYTPSAESLMNGRTGASTPTGTYTDYGGPSGAKHPYPAWTPERQIPLSTECVPFFRLFFLPHRAPRSPTWSWWRLPEQGSCSEQVPLTELTAG